MIIHDDVVDVPYATGVTQYVVLMWAWIAICAGGSQGRIGCRDFALASTMFNLNTTGSQM